MFASACVCCCYYGLTNILAGRMICWGHFYEVAVGCLGVCALNRIKTIF